ncbi:MAG TPA: hypothetical protein VFW53_04490, partial [Gallionella sp.]|nr:hypothetical protein [Gallionella sp.]
QIADGVNAPLPETLTAKFIGSYTAHIAVEEAELLPLAARLLSQQQLIRIGASMAERRGAKVPSLQNT